MRRKWQAKVWVAAKERHVHLGFFDSATEAAVEVAKARADGLWKIFQALPMVSHAACHARCICPRSLHTC